MADAPKVIASDEKFRIVRTANGSYVVEMEDGCDGLGVERWRHCELGERGQRTITQLLRDYIIKEAVKKERADAEAE